MNGDQLFTGAIVAATIVAIWLLVKPMPHRKFRRYSLDITNDKWSGSVTYRGESAQAAMNLLRIYNDAGSTYYLTVDTDHSTIDPVSDYELIKKILIGEESIA